MGRRLRLPRLNEEVLKDDMCLLPPAGSNISMFCSSGDATTKTLSNHTYVDCGDSIKKALSLGQFPLFEAMALFPRDRASRRLAREIHKASQRNVCQETHELMVMAALQVNIHYNQRL